MDRLDSVLAPNQQLVIVGDYDQELVDMALDYARSLGVIKTKEGE